LWEVLELCQTPKQEALPTLQVETHKGGRQKQLVLHGCIMKSAKERRDPRMELPVRRVPLHENDGFMFWFAVGGVALIILLTFGACYWTLWLLTKLVTG
jgi:hypothetical protein